MLVPFAERFASESQAIKLVSHSTLRKLIFTIDPPQ